MPEKYNLKWDDFHNNASKSFGLFRNESYLQDVTLVSDDLKHFSAHKLVLSACSEYFKSIFQQTKQSQPLICLGGVTSTDLRSMLDYVYDGEVKISQQDLDSFLSTANRLKLNGLISEEVMKPKYYDYQSPTQNEYEFDENEEKQKHHTNEMYEESITKNISRSSKGERGLVVVKDEIKMQINQMFEESVETQLDGTLVCKVCGKMISTETKKRNRVANMKSHLEIHMGLTYDCKMCDKICTNSNALNAHIYYRHRNK